MPAGCLALFFIMLFLGFLPFFLANVAITALSRLGMSPESAFLVLLGIVVGSMINIPVKTLENGSSVENKGGTMYGVNPLFPRPVRRRSYTVIALNAGGGLIPLVLALYQVVRIARLGVFPLATVLVAVGVNIIVCYHIARPVRGVGIAMRPLIPGLLAAISALLFMPHFAPPLAFSAGVLGPLIGADLLHLKDIGQSPTGMASIGGAGTFDGIVISGLLALLLA